MFACTYACALHVCLLPVEGRRGCRIPWNWSHRWLSQYVDAGKLNPGPQQELFTSELSHQSRDNIMICLKHYVIFLIFAMRSIPPFYPHFFLKKLFDFCVYRYFARMYVRATHVCLGPIETRRGVISPGTGAINGHELPLSAGNGTWVPWKSS